MTKIQTLLIAQIRRDSGAQFRVGGLNEAQVESLIDAIERGDKIPAITVFFDGAFHWMGGGDHRIEAHVRTGKTEIEAEVFDGGQRDAVFFGTGDNANHGLPRSPKTKRAQVVATLEGWPELGVSGVAKHVKVGRQFVYQVINDNPHLSFHTSESREYTDKHGNISTMKTGNIGKHLRAESAAIIGLDANPIHKSRREIVENAAEIGRRLTTVYGCLKDNTREGIRFVDWVEAENGGDGEMKGAEKLMASAQTFETGAEITPEVFAAASEALGAFGRAFEVAA